MSFAGDLKGTRDYIVTAVKGVWGTTTHEPPEIPITPPFTWVQTVGVTIEPSSIGYDKVTVVWSVAGRFDKVTNLDDAKIDKLHAVRDAILADPHAGGYCTMVDVVGAEFSDRDPKDPYYEVEITVTAVIEAARP